MNVRESVQAMIRMFAEALEQGIEHRSLRGKKLETIDEVLEALIRDGAIHVGPEYELIRFMQGVEERMKLPN